MLAMPSQRGSPVHCVRPMPAAAKSTPRHAALSSMNTATTEGSRTVSRWAKKPTPSGRERLISLTACVSTTPSMSSEMPSVPQVIQPKCSASGGCVMVCTPW